MMTYTDTDTPQRPCKFCGEHVEDVDDPDPDFGDPVWVHWGCLP